MKIASLNFEAEELTPEELKNIFGLFNEKLVEKVQKEFPVFKEYKKLKLTDNRYFLVNEKYYKVIKSKIRSVNKEHFKHYNWADFNGSLVTFRKIFNSNSENIDEKKWKAGK
jgi:hypothetical protein